LKAGGKQSLTRLFLFFIFYFLIKLFYFILFYLELWEMGVQDPHFLKLALILGSVKCSILHGDWKFLFFSNFIFPKFRIHMDLHIYR
jgi:hypothetical protein